MESDLKQGLLNAYRRLLRPLVRILIRNGIAFGEFADIAKEVYVDVAATDFQVPHKKMSQSRISILTGLTRKDVSKLLSGEGRQDNKLIGNHNRVTRVLTGWHTDPEFTGPYGLPLELQFESSEKQSGFTTLVQRHSGDMPARAMLDELLRIGVVIETDSGWYKATTRTYTPAIDNLDSLERLGGVVYNFVSTVDKNFLEENSEKKNFERYVFADNGIRKQDLPRFRAFIKKRAQQLLEEIDNWLSQLPAPESEKQRINSGLGIYHFINEDDPDE